RAAVITWRYKFLWIFGILMALCGQAGGGQPQFQTNYRTSFDPAQGMPEFPAYFPAPFGEVPMAVYVGVVSAHRDEAFRACRYIIDEIKLRLPIWKKEFYRDGDSGWVNCERCAESHSHD
ncbi:MAG: molybdenum cofactor biosynthesis protein MoaE, partial [Xanthomonadales bacterium]|nr:molybdenum cofactor biosynthesis protein MoaE [Xanthomonadales bacterium]